MSAVPFIVLAAILSVSTLIFAVLWLRAEGRATDTHIRLTTSVQDERATRIGEQRRHGVAISDLTNRLCIAEASADVMAMHTQILCNALSTKTVFNRIPVRFIGMMSQVQSALNRHHDSVKERNIQFRKDFDAIMSKPLAK